MKKMELEQYLYVPVPKTKQVFPAGTAMVMSKTQNISGHQFLVVHFFKKNEKHPWMVLFQTGSSYETWVFDEVKRDFVKKTSSLAHLLERKDNGYSEVPVGYLSVQDSDRILAYCKKYDVNSSEQETTDAVWKLEQLQQNIRKHENAVRKDHKRKDLDETMKMFQEIPEAAFCRLTEENVKTWLLYDGKKGSTKHRICYCSNCRKEFEMFSEEKMLKAEKKADCPGCGKTGELVTWNNARAKMENDLIPINFVQRKKDKILISIVHGYLHAVTKEGQYSVETCLYENTRYVLNKDGKEKGYKLRTQWPDKEFWAEGYRGMGNPLYFGMNGYNQFTNNLFDNCGPVYPKNLKPVLKGTPAEYCGIDDFIALKHNVDVRAYLSAHLQVPMLESMVKVGLKKLSESVYTIAAEQREENIHDGYYNYISNEMPHLLKLFDVKEKKLGDFLRLPDKKTLQYAVQKDITIPQLKLMQTLIDHDGCLNQLVYETLENAAGTVFSNAVTESIKKILEYVPTTMALRRYLLKQSRISGRDISFLLEQYSDYFRMAENTKIKPFMNTDFYRYPIDLVKSHNDMASLRRVQNTDIYKRFESQIQEIHNNLNSRFGLKGDSFALTIPETVEEIFEEGANLEIQRCVVNYIEAMATNQCMLVFLRDNDHPDKAIGILEVRGGDIQQARKRYNLPLPKEQQQFIDEWAAKHGFSTSFHNQAYYNSLHEEISEEEFVANYEKKHPEEFIANHEKEHAVA